MKHPNRRYGNPEEFRYYTQGFTLKEISDSLHRDEKTIRRWLNGEWRIPFWVPELVRLRHEAANASLREAGYAVPRAPVHAIGQTAAPLDERSRRAHAAREKARADVLDRERAASLAPLYQIRKG